MCQLDGGDRWVYVRSTQKGPSSSVTSVDKKEHIGFAYMHYAWNTQNAAVECSLWKYINRKEP